MIRWWRLGRALAMLGVELRQSLPGANTQGKTLDEARGNLREAVELIIESHRALAQRMLSAPM